MDEKIKLLISQLGEHRIKTNEDVAEIVYIATTIRELIKVVELCQELDLPYTVIGSGSKAGLSPSFFKGMLVKNRSSGLKIFGIKGKVSRAGLGIEEAFIEADSGNSLTRVAEYTDEQKLTGLEILHSVKGTLGGSLLINPILEKVVYLVKVLTKDLDVKEKKIKEISDFDIILSVVFKLKAKTSI